MPDQPLELKEQKNTNKNKPKGTFFNHYVIISILACIIVIVTYLIINREEIGDKEVTSTFKAVAEDRSSKYLKIGEFVIKLFNSNNYVKMVLVLKIEDSDEKTFIEDKIQDIRDTVQTFLKDLRPNDFNGSAGSIMIKVELLKRINKVIQPNIAEEVLIQEFLIN